MACTKKRKKFEEMNQTERITYWKKKLDEVWSWLVRDRDGKCRCCGRGRPEVTLYGHHWFLPKTYSLVLRWNLLNGIALCYGCHKFKYHLFAAYCHIGPVFRKLDADGTTKLLQWERTLPDLKLSGKNLEDYLSARFMQLDSMKQRRDDEVDEHLQSA